LVLAKVLRISKASSAQSAYEEALEIYRTLAKASPDAYLSGVAMILNNLGILYRGNNAHTKAQSAYEEALEIRRTLAKTNPDTYLSECHCHLR
jgi:tetratricopeptide (TPR) repeat protein